MRHQCLRCKKIHEEISTECFCGGQLFAIMRKLPKTLKIQEDVEAIRVIKPGKYLIDLKKLITDKQLIVRLAPGKYYVDLVSSFGNRISKDNLIID